MAQTFCVDDLVWPCHSFDCSYLVVLVCGSVLRCKAVTSTSKTERFSFLPTPKPRLTPSRFRSGVVRVSATYFVGRVTQKWIWQF
jgi:hypothetical protein